MRLFDAIPELRNWILPELNDDIESLTPASHKAVVFKCPECRDEDSRIIHSVVYKRNGEYHFTGCMKCGYLKLERSDIHVSDVPNLMKYWDSENNPDPTTIISNSKDAYNWKCDICGYRWTAAANSRNKPGKKCPNCQDGNEKLFTQIPNLFDWLPDITETYSYTHSTCKEAEFTCPDCGNSFSRKINGFVKKTSDGYKLKSCPICHQESRSTKHIPFDEKYPELLDVWLDTINGPLSDATNNSINTYFWECPTCGQHFQASIRSMSRGIHNKDHGCPYCSGKIIPLEKSFMTLYPELFEEFSLKNLSNYPDINVGRLSTNSRVEYLWQCRNNPEHTWSTSIKKRVAGERCPYCYGGKKQLLGEHYPELEKYYDAEHNDKPFSKIELYEETEYQWICDEGHSFLYRPKYFARRSGFYCPICNRVENSFASSYPELLEEWDYQRNDISPDMISAKNDRIGVWLICPEGHSYNMTLMNRLNYHESGETACSVCRGVVIAPGINSFAALHPDLLNEWIYELNDIDPDTVSENCMDKVYWQCSEDHAHQYQLSIKERIQYQQNGGNPCNICRGTVIVPGVNSFAALHSDLLSEWIYELNDIDPDTVSENCMDKVYWQCNENPAHQYQLSIKERIQYQQNGGNPCNICRGTVTVPGINSFAALYPELLKEWIYINNYLLADPDKTSPKSHFSVWWQCPNNRKHKYKMTIADRLMFQKRHREPCPFCKGRRRKMHHFI